MPTDDNDSRDEAQPMDPERLADLRRFVETSTTPAGSWIASANELDIFAELLADRDRLAAELDAAIGEHCLLAWMNGGYESKRDAARDWYPEHAARLFPKSKRGAADS